MSLIPSSCKSQVQRKCGQQSKGAVRKWTQEVSRAQPASLKSDGDILELSGALLSISFMLLVLKLGKLRHGPLK